MANAGQALKGNGRNLSATFRRFEPTGRDLAKLNGLLAKRRVHIRNSIHSFRQVIEAIGSKDRQLAELVDSSNAVFAALARQDARLRDAVRQLPPTLRATQSALGKADLLARELGPTLQGLRRWRAPSGRRCARPGRSCATRSRSSGTACGRSPANARPTVRALRPAAANLAKATPDFVTSFKVINYLLNELAYNPKGSEEGYLFWTAWANHAGTSVFQTQDAHGPIRHGSVIASCSTLLTLDQVILANPQLGDLTQLLNPVKSSAACGQTSQAPGSGGG